MQKRDTKHTDTQNMDDTAPSFSVISMEVHKPRNRVSLYNLMSQILMSEVISYVI